MKLISLWEPWATLMAIGAAALAAVRSEQS